MTSTTKCKWKTASSNSLFIINKTQLMKKHNGATLVHTREVYKENEQANIKKKN